MVYNMRDRAVAIQDRNRLASLNHAKKPAQLGFELRNTNLLHDQM